MLSSSPPPAGLPPPKRRFGVRLTRLPAAIFTVSLLIIVLCIAYTLKDRWDREARYREMMKTAASSADASSVTKDWGEGFVPVASRILGAAANTAAPPKEVTKPPPIPEEDPGREQARVKAWTDYWAQLAQVKKEHFDKRKDGLGNLATAQPVSAHAPGGGAAEGQVAPAPTSPSNGRAGGVGGVPGSGGGWGGGGYGGGFGWGGGLPWGGGWGGGLVTPQIDREGQEQKLQFAGQKGDLGKDDYVPTVRKPPDPLAIIAGSFVKFKTITESNSDVPGSQIGMITENVYNNDGSCILVPQGSKIIGHYNSVVSTGQERLPGVLTRINFPDGSHQAIGAMESADAAGSAGQEDQINRHLIQKFGGAFLAGLFGASIQLAVPHNNVNGYDSTQILAASIGQQMGQLGQSIALQNLSIPNTIVIRAGYEGTMITDKDIHIEPPWSCNGKRRNISPLPIMAVQ